MRSWDWTSASPWLLNKHPGVTPPKTTMETWTWSFLVKFGIFPSKGFPPFFDIFRSDPVLFFFLGWDTNIIQYPKPPLPKRGETVVRWGEWSFWSACSCSCAGGTKRRNRVVVQAGVTQGWPGRWPFLPLKNGTVDGVEVGSLSHDFSGFYICQVFFFWDFWTINSMNTEYHTCGPGKKKSFLSNYDDFVLGGPAWKNPMRGVPWERWLVNAVKKVGDRYSWGGDSGSQFYIPWIDQMCEIYM